MGKKNKSENVQVILRVRPLNKKEKERGDENAVKVHLSENAVTVAGAGMDDRMWAFDGVYTNAFTQKDVYLQSIHPVVETVLSGFNGTIFAYGQSGTGKTYSMCGNLGKVEEYGIIPNALNHIFTFIKDNQTDMMEYNVFASFVELYNGKCRDLCVEGSLNLELKENPQKLFFVKDLSLHEIKTTEQAMELMEEGLTRREVKSTDLNADSSRSHSSFSVYVRTWDKEQDLRTEAKLNLVDLAGSERQKQSGASGDTLKEGNNINLSLTALGTVIDCLVKGKPHIPYRSSPLTMLLKDGLGGNSRTIIVGTIGPSESASHESVSTLRFIDRAKQIKNKPKVQMDPKDAKIAELLEEVKKLRRQLGLDEDVDAEDDGDEEAKMKRKGSTVKLFDDEMEALRRRIEELEVQVEMSSETVLSAESKDREYQAKTEKMAQDLKEKEESFKSKLAELEDSKELLKMSLDENSRNVDTLQSLCINFLTQVDKDGVWTSTVHLDSKESPKKGGPQPPDIDDIGRGLKMFVGNGVDMKLHALTKRSSFAFTHGQGSDHISPSRQHAAPAATSSSTNDTEAAPKRDTSPQPHPPSAAPPADGAGAASLHKARLEATPAPGSESDSGAESDPLGPAPKKDKEKKKKKDKDKKKKKDKKSKSASKGGELPQTVVDQVFADAEIVPDVKLRNLVDNLLAKQRVLTSQLQQERLSKAISSPTGGPDRTPELVAALDELNDALASSNETIALQKSQITKARTVAEKKMQEVTQLKEHVESLRAELNEKHTKHAAEIALQQDRLVAQHSKKMEQLMNKQAKALVKERKNRDAIQHKLDKQIEKYQKLEQDYDVKLMEAESIQRDLEELKLESLRKYKESLSVQMGGGFSTVDKEEPAAVSRMMAQLRQSVTKADSAEEQRLERLRTVVEKAKNGTRKESKVLMPKSAPEALNTSTTSSSNGHGSVSPSPFSRNFLDVGRNAQ